VNCSELAVPSLVARDLDRVARTCDRTVVRYPEGCCLEDAVMATVILHLHGDGVREGSLQ
jgi:hypothetical protein